ncbi:hypothetical protein HK101_005631 [Irineochytrium annulatum]|nr:hypothetical protein HK101_005631 [Irineochytrium annulatum]
MLASIASLTTLLLAGVPAALAGACTAPGYTNLAPLVRFTDIVVFGASYIDDGHRNNAPLPSQALVIDPQGNVQFTGRNSNGPTFAERLAGTNGSPPLNPNGPGGCVGPLLNATLHNMAFSGAACDNTIFGQPMPAANQPQSVVQQVASTLAAGLVTALNPQTTLYLFLPATQDISGQGAKNNATVSQLVALCYQNQMAALAQAGAKNFLLGTMYPNDQAPENQQQAPATIANIQAEIATMNTALATVPATFKTYVPNANVWMFDTQYTVKTYLWANAPYFYGVPLATIQNAACSAGGTAVGACRGAADTFFWWDGHHPTRQTHGYFAQVMYILLSVPPAGGALV